MGELQRSLITTGVLSTQQLTSATNYLRQTFASLVALTQINSGDMSGAIEQILQSGQGESGESTSSVPKQSTIKQSTIKQSTKTTFLETHLTGKNFAGSRSINIKRQDKLVNQFFSIPAAQDSVTKTILTQEEVAIFVQVCSYLCQQHQELIRRAVSLMEQLAGEGADPWQATLLDNYAQSLEVYYSHAGSKHADSRKTKQLGAKSLLDLLFYSSAYGQERLWHRCTEPLDN